MENEKEIKIEEWEKQWLNMRGGRCVSDVAIDNEGKYVIMLTHNGISVKEYLPLSKESTVKY